MPGLPEWLQFILQLAFYIGGLALFVSPIIILFMLKDYEVSKQARERWQKLWPDDAKSDENTLLRPSGSGSAPDDLLRPAGSGHKEEPKSLLRPSEREASD